MKRAGKLRERLKTYLENEGLRITKVRFNVVEALTEMDGHFDADSLYFYMRQRGRSASRATVYRTLDLLHDAGIVYRISTEGQALYEVMNIDEHHDHMFCINCNQIYEFYNKNLEKLQDKICHENGFKPTRHSLRIWGLCKECQE